MNQRDQKRQNRELVLSLLRSCPHISQVEIADLTKLQPSTTSNLVRDLKRLGIVTTVGKKDSGPQGGKKAEILALRGEYGSFGGIYLKEDELILGVSDFTGTLISRKQLSISGQDDAAVLSAIVEEIIANAHAYPAYRGTGLAVSSVVNLDGDIAESLYFGRAIPRIVTEIRASVPELPIVVDNDANCAADWDYSTQRDGFRNLVHLQVQTSPVTIGAGIVLGGQLYRGTRGAAGELATDGALEGAEGLARSIEQTASMIATLLDTEALYISGELDGTTLRLLEADAERLSMETGRTFRILDSPDLPVLGASLQAIRTHLQQLTWES